ncbi:hypothetical protein [Pseudovibrio ascidiaceicola]|uniref:hypothetical protein n=1 Tax=Pseudovibrio ascidiaceicola TaxID=285279 RepID=UPI000D693AE2|nr:hypothetical protein [Pseudovibrio ascidiaceicola]
MQGRYPIYNLWGRAVTEQNGTRKVTELPKIAELRQVTPHSGIPLVIDLSHDENTKVIIEFHTKNGDFRQDVDFRKVDGVYQSAFALRDFYQTGDVLQFVDFGEGIPMSFANRAGNR